MQPVKPISSTELLGTLSRVVVLRTYGRAIVLWQQPLLQRRGEAHILRDNNRVVKPAEWDTDTQLLIFLPRPLGE